MWKVCAGLVVLLALAGCNTSGCKCPASGCDNCSASSSASAVISLSSDAASVSGVSADSPCSATLDATLDRVLVSRLGPGACTVQIVLGSGVTEVSHVQFTPTSGGCGCYLAQSASPFQPTDAAAQSRGD